MPHKHELTHVRHDPAHCLAPGLFRALKRGERKRSKLDVTYDYGDGKRIEFSGPEPLGADDLRILQGLVAMAGPNGGHFRKRITAYVKPARMPESTPLGWEHINLTGDYLWRSSTKVGAGKFRPLRPLPPA